MGEPLRNDGTTQHQFDVVDEMMPVELMEWFRELEESALLLMEDGHLLLDPNAERAFIIWWLREMARMPKHQQKCLFGSVHPTVPVELDKEMPLLHLSLREEKHSASSSIMSFLNQIYNLIKLKRTRLA